MEPKVSISFCEEEDFERGPDGFEMDYNETLQLLQDQENIATAIVESARGIDPDSDTGKRLSLSIARVRNHFNRLYQTIPIHKRPATAESAVKAQEVFSTPELLEEIQSYLPIRPRLQSMGMQRCWRDTLNGSVKLKRSLGLEPFEKHKDIFHSAFTDYDFDGKWVWRDRAVKGLNFPVGTLYFIRPKLTGEIEHYGDGFYDDEYGGFNASAENTIKVRIFDGGLRSLDFGSRVRQMLICSGPALTRLDAYARCPRPLLMEYPLGSINASSPKGITLGEFVDQVTEMRKRRPRQDSWRFREISFQASLTLDHNDPLMVAIRHEEEVKKERIRINQERDAAVLRRRYEEIQARALKDFPDLVGDGFQAELGYGQDEDEFGPRDRLDESGSEYE